MFQLQSRVFRENKSRVCSSRGVFTWRFPEVQRSHSNNGRICLNDLDVTEKAETFVHYTYEKSNNRLMITDLQGVGYQLCDPEIATLTIKGEKSDKTKMLVEYLFCAGNLSTTAFENFEREHICNKYCTKLELTQL